ncbi:hypothetical protein FBZ93_111158 [Bradyrhizobium macuxiense]|uniref:Uncharacterized protein n=1 Tax=Bradyrhizobium macuxiense TaxID=1755647 RepID=A0A560LD39_9BRAD|nr:hypothetical protein FBZ93_111158 [Bradyrhizobium macuxiense]
MFAGARGNGSARRPVPYIDVFNRSWLVQGSRSQVALRRRFLKFAYLRLHCLAACTARGSANIEEASGTARLPYQPVSHRAVRSIGLQSTDAATFAGLAPRKAAGIATRGLPLTSRQFFLRQISASCCKPPRPCRIVRGFGDGRTRLACSSWRRRMLYTATRAVVKRSVRRAGNQPPTSSNSKENECPLLQHWPKSCTAFARQQDGVATGWEPYLSNRQCSMRFGLNLPALIALS